jgi:hypothetical protein
MRNNNQDFSFKHMLKPDQTIKNLSRSLNLKDDNRNQQNVVGKI